MAQERGYQRQSGTSAPVGLPGASPAAFGAGIGAEVAQIGQTLHQEQLRAYQIERQQQADSEAAAFNATFAKLREEADKASTDARNGAAPGGAGHAQAMQQWYAQRTQGLIDGITDDRVRRSAQMQLEEFGGRLNSAEYQWQEGRRVGKIVTDQTQARDVAANRAYRMSDPKAFAEELSLGRQGIEALSGVPADVLDGLIRDYDEAVSVGFFNGMIERDPKRVAQILDTGKYDAILSPQQMERLRNGAEIGVRKQENEEERARLEQVARVKAFEDGWMEQAGNGVAVDPEVGYAAARRVEADDPARAARFRQAAAGAAVVQAYDTASPAQITTAMGQIEAKKDWRSSPDLVAKHAALEKLQGRKRDESPAWAPVDEADARAIAARSVERQVWAAGHNGRQLFFGADQAEQLKQAAAGGAAGRASVADVLSRLEGADAQAALRQVAPNDAVMRQAITLPPALRAQVFKGEERRRTAEFPRGDGAMSDLRERWGERGEVAMAGLPGEARTAVFQATRNLYAALATDGEWDEKTWDRALDLVLGHGDGGGIGTVAGKPTILPRGMSQEEMNQRLANLPATIDAFWKGGRRIARDELLSRFQFVATGEDGVYRMVDRSGRVAVGSEGRPATLNVRRLSPRPVPRAGVVAPRGSGVPTSAYGAAPLPAPSVRGPVFVVPPR